MPPVHRSPNCGIWVVLIEKMVYAFMKNHTIGIIHPSKIWGEMVNRTVLFRFGRLKLDFNVLLTGETTYEKNEEEIIFHKREVVFFFRQK